MKDTAPISLGIIAVSGLFGLIAAGVAYVLYEFGLAGSVFIGGIVAVIVAIILMLGWRSPQGGPTGPRDMSPQNNDAHRGGAAPSATGTPVGAQPVMAGTSAGGSAALDTQAATTASAAPAASAPTAPAKPSPSTATAADATVAQKADDTAIMDAPKKKAAPAKKKAAPAAPATDAVVSDDDKPELLTAARAGGPDDLKQIKGVGPKMEGMLHNMGVFHFDQVASWEAKEVAWVDANLEGFKGRVSRDNWVDQAKLLAAGGETEFSKKVGKGGVY